MKKFISILLLIVLLAGLGFGVVSYQNQAENEQIENAGMAQNAPERIRSLTYQESEYPLKKQIQTILLIGTDNEGNEATVPEGFTAFYNYNQADFLMLLVLDQNAQTVEMIQINRDTMTDVPWLDVLGNYGGTNVEQLCLAFNSGSGGADSCQNTVDAVSSMMFDAPIDAYIQIPVSEIAAINDLVGGVYVTIEEDMTVVDPAFVPGATVLLKGKQAEKFVRSRMVLEDDTNLARMRRQRVYLDGFQKSAKAVINSDSEFLMNVLEQLGNYLQTNLTGDQLLDVLERMDTYKVAPIRVPEGTLETGGEYYEFYVDETSLWEHVKAVYCQ